MDKELFASIVAEMKVARRERRVDRARLRGWERTPEAVLSGMKSGCERHAMSGWARVPGCRAGVVGLRKGWGLTAVVVVEKK